MISTSPVKIPEASATNSPTTPWSDEQCILVDKDDHFIGSASKVACHRRTNIEQRGMLHRAFSVFLFSSPPPASTTFQPTQPRLLMQRRASTKPTFADCYTNTCCSHPLMHMHPDERDERNLHIGLKRAARRRLQQELGLDAFPLHRLHLVGKVHYQSIDPFSHATQFGEHEIDYILIGTTSSPASSVDLTRANPNEVSWCDWMTQQDISDLLASQQKISPWFRFIAQKWLLNDWWHQLDRLPEMERRYDGSIFRAGVLPVADDRSLEIGGDFCDNDGGSGGKKHAVAR